MPRTKAVKKKAGGKKSKLAPALIPSVESSCEAIVSMMEREKDEYMHNLQTQLSESKLSIPIYLITKTIGELTELPLNWSGNSTSIATQVFDATKTLNETKKKPVVRSSSFGDDGYLTSESSKSTSGRQSRARSRAPKTRRVSKSASVRSQKTGSVDRYKTPAHKLPPATYGTVTPKVKPNTPQVLLRRPKLGEVALSLQGSPLLTGSVMSDHVANINIPLDDGRLLSIQPQKGLRISEIPHFDLETKRQLETLRDNLNKVCAISCKR